MGWEVWWPSGKNCLVSSLVVQYEGEQYACWVAAILVGAVYFLHAPLLEDNLNVQESVSSDVLCRLHHSLYCLQLWAVQFLFQTEMQLINKLSIAHL